VAKNSYQKNYNKKAPLQGLLQYRLIRQLTLCRLYAHCFAVMWPTDLKYNVAIGFGEQGVVAAQADIAAGVEFGTTLAHQDVAGCNQLAAVAFHAEAFTFRLATVAGTARCFLMCHI
jgi:hypothetical protein